MENLIWHNEKRKVSELISYPKNPRKMSEAQAKQLKASIEKFNLVEPPAIDLDGMIISGHQRMKTMILLGRGDETIDVRVPNRKLTSEEFNEYLVRANQNRGEFDFDLLGNLFEPTDLYQWGFTPHELGLPDFSPADGNNDDLGSKGGKGAKEVECPECGHKFNPNAKD